ncbi:MAG: plasmid stabilization protein [Proteobacteria bacterium]|nr:plasmid stabilization protein [Pseudomonadota bacterium]
MPYKIVRTDSYFKKLTKFLKKHPDAVERYIKTIELLEINPFHPSLRLHKLQGKLDVYHSVSINLSYRIVIDLVITEEQIIPIDIGTHDDVYS